MRTYRASLLSVALLGVLLGAGCVTAASTYSCDEASQCVQAGLPGTCEPTGYCSFPDLSCNEGRRYAAHAPAELAGTCTGAVVGDDAGPGRDGPVDAAPPCEGGDQALVSALGRCFSRHDTSTGSVGAAAVCAELGRMVAIFETEAEELEITRALLGDRPFATYYINLQDDVVEGSFRWADDRALTYANWTAGEPNDDFLPAAEDSVVVERRGDDPDWHWVDVPSGWTAGVICMDPPSAPAPSGELYTFIHGRMTQPIAARACTMAGSSLATVTSTEEALFVAAHGRNRGLWIGGGDAVVEGTYTWASGVPWDFEYWADDEPTNPKPPEGTEDCIFAYHEANGQWADAPCDLETIGGAACDQGR